MESRSSTQGKLSSRSRDVISMLVSLAGSKETFITEYTSVLSGHLLAINDYDIDKEFGQVEFFKMKFGEQNLHKCEVMLKDVSDSKRINEHIHAKIKRSILSQEVKSNHVLQATVVSGLFWPNLNTETFSVPEQMKFQMDKYAKEYEMWKNRKLHWLSHMGTMNISLDFGKKSLDFNVTPLQGSVIMLFSEKVEWTIEEMAEKLKVNSHDRLSRVLSWWIGKGIVKRGTGDMYTVVTEDDGQQMEDFMEEEVMELEIKEDKEALKVQQLVRHCVISLCQNQSTPFVSLDRIHMSLGMFLPDYALFFKNTNMLHDFLSNLVKEGVLECSRDEYRLPS
eukprot:TRINITY_DN2624_c0_g1_i16.p1 TRINITY_DN2624_c0_g1~~TRINITY_DN2624_c0_g1_i16.p1  ORF type:complete len:336 (-),score=81.60 TRINITY_DN2624_c0_g1_i16:1277-2284(-)